MENRFRNNSCLRDNYVKFIDEYEKPRHMAESPIHSNMKYKYRNYMPQHAVIRNDSITTIYGWYSMHRADQIRK